MENNNLRNPSVPYASSGVPQRPVQQAPTPLFADVARTASSAPLQPTNPPLTTTPVNAVPTTPAPAPLPAATPPLATPVNPVSSAIKPPKKPRDWRKIILAGSFATLFLLFIGAAWLIFEAVSNNGRNQSVNSEIASTSIPLSEFAGSGSLNLLGTQSLAVNGQLRANESFVLAPQAQPTKSERGQLYFDSGTNRLAYYNGSQFVQIPGEEEPDAATVLTLQGQSGNITLVGGEGLAVNGTTLTNTGVTSFGGATGAITLGQGVTITDGTLSNTGVLGATGGAGISVTDDGNGNITISNVGAGTGTVNSPNGTPGRIAKFTGVQTIEDSLLSEAGTTVTVNGNLNVTGTTTLGTALGVNSGGTGATTLAANGVIIGNGSGALTAVTAGGAGECLISTGGAPVFQACPGGGGGVTSLNGLTGALTIANATTGGSTITLNDASTAQKGIAQFNSTNFSASGGVINTIQDIAVASAPTFGRLTVTSSQASNGMLLVNNTNAGASGNLLDVQLNGSSRLAVSPAGAMTVAGTVNGQTISSAASFTGTLAVAGAASLNGGATVTGTLTANTITPTGALTVGATNQSFLVQGNASSTITATSGASTTTVAFQTPTANVTYRLLTAAAGTYDICTTAGNCSTAGGVTTVGGTTNRLAKFTGSQAIGDSIITDNGTTVTIGGTLAVNTITPSAAMTIGTTSQNLTLQGADTTITETNGGFTNSLVFATPAGSSKTITLPNATGTVAVSASGPLSVDSNGNITCATCVTSGGGGGGVAAVDSLNGLTGALTIANASGSGNTVTINDASTAQKGIAQFNSSNFSASSGTINTIQDIGVAAAPTFGRLTVTSSQASNAMFLINNTNAGASGNLLDVQLNGSSRLAVTPAGAMTLTGTVNGQTISSAANFTDTLAVAGAASLNGGASVTGTLTANTIIPTSSLTVGATNQSFLVQGSSTSTITATSGANTTTLAFQTPTAAVTYRFLTAAAGTYDVCTTAGNCATAGGVTTSGGTTNRLAKFTGSTAIGDSIITDNGSTVTIGGTLAVNTLTPTSALTIGATSQNLTMQGASVNLTSTSGAFTNTLSFATPAGSSKAITVPNASGTLVVSASGPLAIDSAGNITCSTCAISGSGVTSLNSLTGALTIANASAAGSTITINDASTAQKGIAQFNSTNFSASSGTINTIQDIATTSAPQFGRLQVGSGQASATMLIVNNSNVSASGNLIDLRLNGSSRMTVSPAGDMTLVGNLNGQTISSAANLTGTLAVAGAASLNGGASVTGTLTANTITPTSALTVGATSQSFLVQGSAASTITATSGANTTTVGFQSPTAAVTYRFLTAAAGTYDICTTAGNCAVAGGVTTSGGTTNRLAKFTGSTAIGDSIITDNGSTVTIGGTLAVNTLTPTSALTVGATGQNLTMQGATVNLTSTAGGVTNTLSFATPSSGNKTITIPNASGTLVVSASGPLAIDSAGNITCSTCATTSGVVTSLNSLTGALTIANASTGGSTITINDASTAQKGIAQFNATNFSASSGTINTIQNINTTAAPTFGQLTLTSSQASAAMIVVNNTNVSASGNLLDLQLNGASRLAVSPAGAMTIASTINGQTISSAASFTGTLAVAGTANLNGGATVTGTLNANTITPTGSLTVGATSQSFLLQGNGSSTITATNSGSTTTLSFQTPTANVNYRLLTAAAGTYDICTSVGNCGGVTTSGGTTGKIAKFTGANTLGDSIMTESGSVITVAGTVAATTSVQTTLLDTASAAALNIGTTNATSIGLNQNTVVAAGKTLTVTSGLTSLTGATVGDALNVSNSTSAGNIAVFKDNATAVLTIADGGNILAKNTVDSTTAMQVQNSAGGDVISIDTSDFNYNTDNMIANSGIDDNTTGWAVKGTASSLARETVYKRTGRGALRVNTNAANDGVKYNVTLTNGSTYTATFYVQIGSGFQSTNTITAGYSSNGTTDNVLCDDQDFPRVGPNGYVKFTCRLTAAAPSGTPYFYIKQSDATARQLLIDDVLIVNDTIAYGVTTPSNGGINLQGVVTSPIVMQNFANTSNAFQILNDVGNSIFNVGNDDDNLIEDGSFETNELFWGGSNINDYATDPSISLFGSRSFRVGTNATANAGVSYVLANSDNLVLPASTTYSLSWYARIPFGGTPFTDMKARYTYNGSAFTECTPTLQSVPDYGWSRLSCTFTTPASTPTASAAIYIVQTGATAHTFYLDGIRLEQGSTAKLYGNGTVSLDAVINSPMTIRNKYDTTNALSVQSFDGNTLFNVDTSNYGIQIGATDGGPAVSTYVEIATSTTAAQSVYIGSTVGSSQTVLRSGTGDLYLYTDASSASIIAQSGTDNTDAFQVINSGNETLFNVDTTNSRVNIGNPTADTTGALLVLDTKTSAGDPTVSGSPTTMGAMYFNSSTQTFRCYANTTWRDCAGGRYVQSNQGNQSGNLPPAGDTVSNTTTGTTFSDVYSVPANDCVPGRTYRITAGGLYSTNATSQGYNIQLMWGSTVIGNTDSGSAQTPGITATNENWYLQATVTCYTNFSSTISAEVRGIVSLSQSASGPPQMGFLRNASTGQTITTGSAQNLGVRMTWGTTGDSITMRNFIVEAVGP